MANMVNSNLFMELQASDYHSPTQEHVLTTTHQKAKVSRKKKTHKLSYILKLHVCLSVRLSGQFPGTARASTDLFFFFFFFDGFCPPRGVHYAPGSH
jgi:hypothetical protein